MANIVLGAGKIYLELADQITGLPTGGERYIAETPGFSISVSSEKLEDWSSDGPVAELNASVTTRVTRAGTLTLKDIIEDNLALFLAGNVATVTQTSTPVVDEAFTAVKADHWYQLGASLSNPTGRRNVSSVTITGPGGTPTYVAGTDYEIDLAMARFRPISGSAMVGTNVLVDYTPAANTRKQITTDQLGPRKGALRFIANNTTGANKDVYIPLVELSPDGELGFKSRDAYMSMQFALNIMVRSGYAQVYVDGRPA